MELVKDFVSFMMNENMLEGNFNTSAHMNDVLHEHFLSTLEYCEHILCSTQKHRSVTVNAHELLIAFLNEHEVGKSESELEQSLDKNYLFHGVLKKFILDGKIISVNDYLNFLVFIPRHKSITNFVADCAKNANNETEFMEAILNACETQQTFENEKVYWDEVSAEMKNYSFDLVAKKFARTPHSKDDAIFKSLHYSTFLKIFKKIGVRFDNIVMQIKLANLLEIALDYVKQIEKDRPTSEDEATNNAAVRFLFTVAFGNKKKYQTNYNLSDAQDQFQIVEITKKDFNEMVRKELRGKKFSMTFQIMLYKFKGEESGLIEKGGEFEFPEFPYIAEEDLNCSEMLTDYASFVKTLIDEGDDYFGVCVEFWAKFGMKQSLAAYEVHLMNRSPKKTKDFDELYPESDIEDESELHVGNLKDENPIGSEPKGGIATGSSKKNTKNNYKGLLIIVVLVSFVLFAIFLAVAFHAYGKKKKRINNKKPLPAEIYINGPK